MLMYTNCGDASRDLPAPVVPPPQLGDPHLDVDTLWEWDLALIDNGPVETPLPGVLEEQWRTLALGKGSVAAGTTATEW